MRDHDNPCPVLHTGSYQGRRKDMEGGVAEKLNV